MGQWAIKIWNRDLVIRGVRCWISISILHTSMFYTRECVSIGRERYMVINSNRKLVEVWEQMQHATKWIRKSFPLFQLASRQFQPVFLKEDIGHMVFYNSFVSGKVCSRLKGSSHEFLWRLHEFLCNTDIEESIGVESKRKMEFIYFSIPVKFKFSFQWLSFEPFSVG